MVVASSLAGRPSASVAFKPFIIVSSWPVSMQPFVLAVAKASSTAD